MKPILFLAFLALGPALADQFPVTGPVADPAALAVMRDRAAPLDMASPTAQLESERAWLCRR